ncbi:ATP-binding cassette domain-containing protein [Clostridium neuense]|uniref:ATP-binding cassette domain-containing protein n=1 Tax=Clostridium neuense TaxID=1728934 RepID=A0ABW8TA65_9CLOT
MEYILRTNNLIKVFNGKRVVSDVNMNIKKGEIYGFLGPNGAGKTTVMKLITNLIKPTSGEIEIFGEKLTNSSFEILKRMGTIIEYPVFYDKLTAEENLDLHLEYMGYHDKSAIGKVIDMVNLKNIEGKAVKDFSVGMKQRLGIARSIITKPEFILLDEPINGLDPIGIKEFRSLFKMLSKEYGMTILISTHILAEIEQMADTIGVIDNGKLIEEVSMNSIRESNLEYIELKTNNVEKAAYVLENILKIRNFKIMDDNIIRIYEISISQSEILKNLVSRDVEVEAINRKSSSLEEHFLKLINTF